MAKSGDNDRHSRAPRSRSMWVWAVILMFVLGILAIEGQSDQSKRGTEIPYSEFLDALDKRRVRSVVIEKESGNIRGVFQTSGQPLAGSGGGQNFSTGAHARSIPELEAALRNARVAFSYEGPGVWREFLPFIAWAAVFALIFYFFVYRQMRGGGGMLSFGKSRAIRVTRDKNRKTFGDVAGIDEARAEVEEIVEFLKDPSRFQRLGGRLPRGVLLIGSPGTGKTLLAKAIAGEADVPFFTISGSDFVEMFVGVGASRVRDLFEQAKAISPCIIFLDEIDAVGRKRANDLPGSGIETAQTLNAILVEMDGFQSDDNVIVIAATNRPDVLDPALLRPGRFDRRIYVDSPDVRGREQILAVHVKGIKLADDVDLSIIARGTPTFSGADLESLVNEAALLAAMRGKHAVDMECLEEAKDKVRFGREKRSRVRDEEERSATAYHEAGHALLMRLVPDVTPLHKVTIVPRGRALGATMQLPEKDEYNMGRKRILGEIVVRLGGRAAEEIFLSDITNGAAMDLQQSTALAKSMVCEWGMSEALGLPYLSDSDHSEGEFFLPGKSYSEDTARLIDEEVRRVLERGYAEAKHLLSEHKDDVVLMVAALLEYESLARDEVDLLLKDKSLDALREIRRAADEKARKDKAGDGEKEISRTAKSGKTKAAAAPVPSASAGPAALAAGGDAPRTPEAGVQIEGEGREER
ncbi:MAG: ATP-dependent zinc metalloprotease FtsH [Planctomycetota bacterium]|jgi:cell division protease FtsH|nr:ATP-dependent zinc metalloprotease FtsH [Planctomycetota bacterium]